jgi:hypothetical protein
LQNEQYLKGSFLARNCFRNGYTCTNELCNTLVMYHTRYFVHGDSQISIKMSIIPDDITYQLLVMPTSTSPSSTQLNQSTVAAASTAQTTLLPGEKSEQTAQTYDDISIYLWSVCNICQKVRFNLLKKISSMFLNRIKSH